MATYTPNYNLKLPDGGVDGDFVNIDDLNGNFTAIDAAVAENAADIANLQTIQTATGTATAIELSNIELVDGFQVSFVIALNNEGAAVTINDKSLYKPNTTDAPNLVAGESVTVWYDSTDGCFYIKADTNRELLNYKRKIRMGGM